MSLQTVRKRKDKAKRAARLKAAISRCKNEHRERVHTSKQRTVTSLGNLGTRYLAGLQAPVTIGIDPALPGADRSVVRNFGG